MDKKRYREPKKSVDRLINEDFNHNPENQLFKFFVGDEVEARWQRGPVYYVGKVVAVHQGKNGVTQGYTVKYHDDGIVEVGIPASLMRRPLSLDDDNPVGSRISVFWPLDNAYYDGIITSYDPVKKLHEIKYDDGVIEMLQLADERYRVIEGPANSSNKRSIEMVAQNVQAEKRSKKMSTPKVFKSCAKTPEKVGIEEVVSTSANPFLMELSSSSSSSSSSTLTTTSTSSSSLSCLSLEPLSTSPSSTAHISQDFDGIEVGSYVQVFNGQRKGDIGKVVSYAPVSGKVNIEVLSNLGIWQRVVILRKNMFKLTDDEAKMCALSVGINLDSGKEIKTALSSDQKKNHSEPKSRCDSLLVTVGTCISVFWPLDNTYYSGTVVRYDPVKKFHEIKYDDGETEVLKLADEKYKIIDRSEKQLAHLSEAVPNAKITTELEPLTLKINLKTIRRKSKVAIGSRISVFWPLDNAYYEGTITSYDPMKKLYEIKYDDEVVEVLKLSDEKYKVIRDPVNALEDSKTAVQDVTHRVCEVPASSSSSAAAPSSLKRVSDLLHIAQCPRAPVKIMPFSIFSLEEALTVCCNVQKTTNESKFEPSVYVDRDTSLRECMKSYSTIRARILGPARQDVEKVHPNLYSVLREILNEFWVMDVTRIPRQLPYFGFITRDNCEVLGLPNFFGTNHSSTNAHNLGLASIHISLPVIKAKFLKIEYRTLAEFTKDFRLMFKIISAYYQEIKDKSESVKAEELKDYFEKLRIIAASKLSW